MEVKKFDPLLQGQTRSRTLKTIPDLENIGQNRGVELLCRPCKMKTVAFPPAPWHQIVNHRRPLLILVCE